MYLEGAKFLFFYIFAEKKNQSAMSY